MIALDLDGAPSGGDDRRDFRASGGSGWSRPALQRGECGQSRLVMTSWLGALNRGLCIRKDAEPFVVPHHSGGRVTTRGDYAAAPMRLRAGDLFRDRAAAGLADVAAAVVVLGSEGEVYATVNGRLPGVTSEQPAGIVRDVHGDGIHRGELGADMIRITFAHLLPHFGLGGEIASIRPSRWHAPCSDSQIRDRRLEGVGDPGSGARAASGLHAVSDRESVYWRYQFRWCDSRLSSCLDCLGLVLSRTA